MNETINWPGAGIWAIIGICIAWHAIRQWYQNKDYAEMAWRDRFAKELATVLLCAIFGPLTICFSKILEMPGTVDPDGISETLAKESQDEEDEQLIVGILSDSIVLSGTEAALKSAMQTIGYHKPNNVVEAMKCLQNWSMNYSDSVLALRELFDMDGTHHAIYTYGAGGYEIHEG